MNREKKLKYLRVALCVFGVIFMAGIPAMMQIWPSGWGLSPAQPEYEQVLMGMYITLGAFLLYAAKNPMNHKSLIWFTVVSSLVHGGVTLVQAIIDEAEHANIFGDIPAFFVVAFVLWTLMPKNLETKKSH